MEQLINITDAVFLGHVGEVELGASALAGIYYLVTYMLGFVAANWASKESFAKALGTGVEGFALNEVSCLRDELGCPYLELTGNALLAAENRGLTFAVSLSHIKDIASAVVIAYEKEDKNG